jgi:hypothetical protein
LPTLNVQQEASWSYEDLKLTLLGVLTLPNPIFLPTTYSPALICFGR